MQQVKGRPETVIGDGAYDDRDIQNYRSSNRDHLMWYLQKAYPEEYESAVKSGLMTVIPAHPDASKINDHSILSPTFREPIEMILVDFADNYDCR